MKLILIILGVFVILMFLVVVRSRYETRHFKIKRYNILSDKVNETYKIGYLSDLHNCAYGKDNILINDAVRRENPDLLILGGDMIVGKRHADNGNTEKYYDNAATFINNLPDDIPVLYTYGNHETRMKNLRGQNVMYDNFMKEIEGQKITFLNNSVWRDENVEVLGLEPDDEVYENPELFDEGNLKRLMEKSHGKGQKDKYYRILVSHTPELFEKYCQENIDLVLCGHLHGGTVRLPLVGGLISRDFKLFPRYSYGVFIKNGTTMTVTSGMGDHTVRFRLFNKPELVMVTLSKKI